MDSIYSQSLPRCRAIRGAGIGTGRNRFCIASSTFSDGPFGKSLVSAACSISRRSKFSAERVDSLRISCRLQSRAATLRIESAERLTRGVSDWSDGFGGDKGSGWEGVGRWKGEVDSARRQRALWSRRRCIDIARRESVVWRKNSILPFW